MLSIPLATVTFLNVGDSMSTFQNVEFSIRLSTTSGCRKSRSEKVMRRFSESMETVVHSRG